MVTDFVIDPMHLIYVNAMKRLFQFITGDLKGEAKWKYVSASFFALIGERFASNRYPSEFHRQPRNFMHLKHYKASEQRMLLLYGYEYFAESAYSDNLCSIVRKLAAATRILCDQGLNRKRNEHNHDLPNMQMIDLARYLLTTFIEEAQELFGDHFVTLNSHLLLHIADDAVRGPIDRHGCFKFENGLKSIKRMCTGFKKPVKTLANRLGNEFVLRSNVSKGGNLRVSSPKVVTRNSKRFGTYSSCQYDNILYSTRDPDCYIEENIHRKVCKIVRFEENELTGQISLICHEIALNLSAWTIPLPDVNGCPHFLHSSELGIYKSRTISLLTEELLLGFDDIESKYVRVSVTPNSHVFYPLLPTT